MAFTRPSGLRSPALDSRSDASSPRPQPKPPKFDSESLKTYMKKLLSSTLGNSTWPDKDKPDRVKSWNREIAERVKERMMEIQPRGYKYVVLTQICENLGQGGRLDMISHWEEHDVVAKEMFANDSIVCMCIALAIS